jgi:hypothetical protein
MGRAAVRFAKANFELPSHGEQMRTIINELVAQ